MPGGCSSFSTFRSRRVNAAQESDKFISASDVFTLIEWSLKSRTNIRIASFFPYHRQRRADKRKSEGKSKYLNSDAPLHLKSPLKTLVRSMCSSFST